MSHAVGIEAYIKIVGLILQTLFYGMQAEVSLLSEAQLLIVFKFEGLYATLIPFSGYLLLSVVCFDLC